MFLSLLVSFFALLREQWLPLGIVWKSWVPGQAPSCLGEAKLLLRQLPQQRRVATAEAGSLSLQTSRRV